MGGSYTYQQLPSPTAIRILYLLPGNKHDLLSCQLSTCETTAQPDQHSLVQHQPIPSFEAISYVWGDPEAQEGILCEGKTMMLHQSLANVLRRVRYRHKIRLLWADAVCINQQDNIERGHQVKLMASIYSRASGTLFYITPSPLSLQAKTPVLKIIRDLNTILSPWSRKAKQATFELDTGDIPLDRVSHLVHAQWHDLRTLLESSWFGRAWVVQEYGCSQMGTFLFGEEEIPKEELQDLVTVLTAFGSAICNDKWITRVAQQAFTLMTTYSIESTKVMLYDDNPIQDVFLTKNIEIDFLDILNRTRDSGCEATLAVDHVFAFLGHQSAQKGYRSLAEAGYTKSLQQVFINVAAALINETGGLRLLSAVFHDSMSASMNDAIPSWVPRWDKANPHIQFGGRISSYWYDAEPRIDWDSRAASTKPFVKDGVLIVRGIIVDAIAPACLHFTSFDLNFDRLRSVDFEVHPENNQWAKILDLVATLSAAGASPYFNKKKDNAGSRQHRIALAVQDTLRAGLINWPTTSYPIFSAAQPVDYTGPGSPVVKTPFSSFIVSCLKFRSLRLFRFFLNVRPSKRKSLEKLSRGLARFGNVSSADRWNRDQWLSDVQKVCLDRKLFATSRGYIGLGPGILEAGDLCCTLIGSKVPMILRPRGTQFQLVGEAYIHGIVQTGLRDEIKKGGYRFRTFELI